MTIEFISDTYEIATRNTPGYPARTIDVAAGKDTDQPNTQPFIMLLLPPTNARTGNHTIEELDYNEAAFLAEAIYTNIDDITRHKLREALEQFDQDNANSQTTTEPPC